ncbi:hypothetical protein Bbelb_284050 [Branchiostoma belcheri]|nr:hypothetical protein Bbelb_284050 [Branchiostoma belcheri]
MGVTGEQTLCGAQWAQVTRSKGPESIEELFKLYAMCHHAFSKTKPRVKRRSLYSKSPYYSILIDETTDRSVAKQLIIFGHIPDGQADTIVEKLTTNHKRELLRQASLVKQLRGWVNTQFVDQLFSNVLKSAYFLDQLTPGNHVFLLRLIVLAQAHNTNVREYKDDTRKIVKFISAPGQLVHCPFNPENAARTTKGQRWQRASTTDSTMWYDIAPADIKLRAAAAADPPVSPGEITFHFLDHRK